MYSRTFLRPRSAFTLIELLVVIAIIAILAVVVILALNPAQLLAQSRDANRISDMATLNSAINLYTTDQSGVSSFSLGTSSLSYLSLPDSSSTCGTWGLPSGAACVPATSTRNIDGTGWIPINFKNISAGSPLSSLPIDPTNTSSSGLYYTYTTQNGQFELIAPMESQKYSASIAGALGPGIATQGSAAGAPPIGYWPLNEGSGTIAYDMSGSQNNGTWNGTPTGTNGYYSPGKGGGWAGAFDGGSDYVGNFTHSISPSGTSRSVCAWINEATTTGKLGIAGTRPPSASQGWVFTIRNNILTYFNTGATGSTIQYSTSFAINTWHFVCATYNLPTTIGTLYIDGGYVYSASESGDSPSTFNGAIGSEDQSYIYLFSGLIDDVRIYNRVLSAAEIRALYSSGK
jgi:prepilin-type N-terminal cleavage/methylation domain-containing protein